MTMDEILHEAERLPRDQQWALVKHLMQLLEAGSPKQTPSDYQDFLQETYGSLQETPLQRWPQGEYDEREPLE